MIGNNVVKKLLALEVVPEITILDNFSAYPSEVHQEYLKQLKNVRKVRGDIKNKEFVNNIVKEHNYIIHLASLADVGACIKNPEENFNTDIIGGNNLLQAALKNNIKKFTFASSASVYGNPNSTMVSENANLRPTTPYANSKLWMEQQLRLYYELYGLPTASLRYFSVYGVPQIPKQGSHSWCWAIFTMQALKDKPITVFGDGNQFRDFTYVTDIAEATIRAHYSTKSDGKILNVGTGKQTRIIDVANEVLDLIPKSKSRISFVPMVKGDPLGCVADTTLLESTLNWLPKVSLKDGAEAYIDWIKNNKNLIPEWV